MFAAKCGEAAASIDLTSDQLIRLQQLFNCDSAQISQLRRYMPMFTRLSICEHVAFDTNKDGRCVSTTPLRVMSWPRSFLE